MPIQDLITTPVISKLKFSLESAHNVLQSLFLLLRVEELSGLNEWAVRTEEQLSAQDRDTHRLVMIGFHHVVFPEWSWPSFPAYLQHLTTIEPARLLDKLFDAYLKKPCRPGADAWETLNREETRRAALESPESYLDFLRTRFSEDRVDPEVETHAYEYLVEPEAMQRLIVSHLSYMWDRFMEAEWERVKPMLDASVRAFRQVNLRGRDRLDVVRLVAGQELHDEKLFKLVKEQEQIIFVPNAHLGPYLTSFRADSRSWVFYGARLPEGVWIEAPDLSRNEILVRLSALADDTRLQILKFIAENGEQRSQEIMQRLDLSQSASSRHLTQLSATGFLVERRCEGAKCYRLNEEKIEDTLQAVSAFLLNHPLGGGS